MQFHCDQRVNPGDTVGQKVTLFETKKVFSPCKGRGFNGRDSQLAMAKEHIEVDPHTQFRGD